MTLLQSEPSLSLDSSQPPLVRYILYSLIKTPYLSLSPSLPPLSQWQEFISSFMLNCYCILTGLLVFSVSCVKLIFPRHCVIILQIKSSKSCCLWGEIQTTQHGIWDTSWCLPASYLCNLIMIWKPHGIGVLAHVYLFWSILIFCFSFKLILKWEVTLIVLL